MIKNPVSATQPRTGNYLLPKPSLDEYDSPLICMANVQFETIHPLLDGNGRLGRLLITFLFCAEGALREPLLYLNMVLDVQKERCGKGR